MDQEVSLLARKEVSTENSNAEGGLTPATAERAKRATSTSTRRVLFVVVGVVVLVASVGGFYLTSDAFDERTEVLVAAVDIPAGTILSAGDLTVALADMGSIPHSPWVAGLDEALVGLLASQDIPAGAVVQQATLVSPDTVPDGDELEVIVPLDASLSPSGVAEGDLVLLIDPGVAPVPGDAGRPRGVLEPLELKDFDGSAIRLFVPPEEWARWRALPGELGATPQILPVSPGGDPEVLAQSLDALWYEEWSGAVAELAAAEPVEVPEPAAGPGELEVIVPLDASLVPSGVQQGDRVLLIDPGVAAAGNDPGRPRSVLNAENPLLLDDFDGSAIRLFVPPAEWERWRRLPAELGAVPLVLPVPDGSDAADMARRLDAEWLGEWEVSAAASAAAVAPPEPGQFLVTMPLDASLSPGGVSNGDQVFIIDPGAPGDAETPGSPPRIMETRTLEGWDGGVMRFWADPDRWAYYTFLAENIRAVPWVMAVTVPVSENELADLVDDVNAALARWYPTR